MEQNKKIVPKEEMQVPEPKLSNFFPQIGKKVAKPEHHGYDKRLIIPVYRDVSKHQFVSEATVAPWEVEVDSFDGPAKILTSALRLDNPVSMLGMSSAADMFKAGAARLSGHISVTALYFTTGRGVVRIDLANESAAKVKRRGTDGYMMRHIDNVIKGRISPTYGFAKGSYIKFRLVGNFNLELGVVQVMATLMEEKGVGEDTKLVTTPIAYEIKTYRQS